jgi:hypothetical protein
MMFINEYSRGVGIASEWQFLGDLALVFFVKHGKLDWCFFCLRRPGMCRFGFGVFSDRNLSVFMSGY